MLKIPLFIYILLLLFLFIGCTKTKEEFPTTSDTLLSATQEVTGSTIFCYDGAHLIWKLSSDHSTRDINDSSSTLISPVRLMVYDTAIGKVTKIYSDSGRTAKDLNKFFIWGNVDVRNWDGLRIRSQSLWWNKRSRKVGSDDYVKIITPQGDILKGKGLDASETFSWWTLRHDVSGNFPNFTTSDENND